MSEGTYWRQLSALNLQFFYYKTMVKGNIKMIKIGLKSALFRFCRLLKLSIDQSVFKTSQHLSGFKNCCQHYSGYNGGCLQFNADKEFFEKCIIKLLVSVKYFRKKIVNKPFIYEWYANMNDFYAEKIQSYEKNII